MTGSSHQKSPLPRQHKTRYAVLSVVNSRQPNSHDYTAGLSGLFLGLSPVDEPLPQGVGVCVCARARVRACARACVHEGAHARTHMRARTRTLGCALVHVCRDVKTERERNGDHSRVTGVSWSCSGQ
jgi:hypothetical protein